MLDVVEYLTLLQYSPRGQSMVSMTSKKVKDTIKAGRIEHWRKRIGEIAVANRDQISPFLNPEVTLVPIPRSSMTKENSLWPSLEICKLLESLNLGVVAPCLIRQQAIRKSSLSYRADQRPSIAEQFDSMAVENYVPTENITLVDDVLTLGRTSIAGASRISEKFPNATIRAFALILTKGLDVAEIDKILNIQIGSIKYNPVSGKCQRLP